MSLTGHAAMQQGWMGVAHAASDMLHCLAAGFWLGSLPVFLILLKLFQEPSHRQQAARALMRFSRVGHLAVAILLASGIINALLILPPRDFTLHSLYQELLFTKILIAVSMAALALVNRYRWVPRIRAEGEAALNRILRNTVLEIAAGGMVLLLVGLFGLLSPQ